MLSDIVKRRSFRANGTAARPAKAVVAKSVLRAPTDAFETQGLHPSAARIIRVKSAKLDRCRRRIDLEAKLVFLISDPPLRFAKVVAGPRRVGLGIDNESDQVS